MAASTIISDIQKEIKYDRQTKDYNCLISIDGGPFESIGFASNYSEAERKCNAYAYDYLTDNHAPEAAAELVLAGEPALTYVTVERHWGDEDDNPDAPPEGAEVWTDYHSGCIRIGVNDAPSTDPIDLIIHGRELSGVPITLATLTQIHTDLGHMLADSRVRAALPAEGPTPPKQPPVRMIRIKDFKASCSFPLMLDLSIGVAVERMCKRGKLDLTRSQMFDMLIAVGQVIEDMFDLSVGLGILGTTPDKLADAAYQRGFQEALDAIKGFMELREKSPEKALVSKQQIRAEAGAPPLKQAA